MVNEKLVTLSLPYPDGRDKTVRVFVPEHDEGETFPVIYMSDGQNLFDFDESKHQFGCWYVREAVRDESARSGKGAIIVGIHNDGAPHERGNELTPASIGRYNYPPEMPEPVRALVRLNGEGFAEFIINTVMPAVEKDFPVRTGRESTAFCGSSAGGLEALFIGLTYPDVFSAAGILSPAPLGLIYVTEDSDRWLRASVSGKDRLPFLYFYSGAAEPLEQSICGDMERICGILEELYPEGLMKKVIRPEQRHHEKAWGEVFRDFLGIFLS